MTRISESELVLPSLYLIYLKGGKITMAELIPLLEDIMKPTGRDAEIIANRKDTYFSQKVRNLKSHDTLEKSKYVTYDGLYFHLTSLGKSFINENISTIKYLFNSSFEYTDIASACNQISKKQKRKIICYDEFITEGTTIIKEQKTHNRSQKLRNIAIEHFSHNGTISCDCCGFEFKSAYGPKYGVDCIEIHHLKPIFTYDDEDVKRSIDEALNNLLPVCPNCHRVIHKQHITAELLPDFKNSIIKNTIIL